MINLLLTKLFEVLIGMGNWGVFLSAMGIFPTEIVIAILAAEEGNNLWLIALASALGETIGAYPIYIIGKVVTDENIYKWLDGKGKFLQIDRKKLDKSKKKLNKLSSVYIFFTRFVPYLRVVAGLAAGVLQMNFFIFTLAVFLGSYVYSFLIAYMGFKVGGDLESIKKYINLFDKWILAFAIIYILVSVGLKHKKKIKKWLTDLKEYLTKKLK